MAVISERWAISRSGRRRLHTEDDFGLFFFSFDLVIIIESPSGMPSSSLESSKKFCFFIFFMSPLPPSMSSPYLSSNNMSRSVPA